MSLSTTPWNTTQQQNGTDGQHTTVLEPGPFLKENRQAHTLQWCQPSPVPRVTSALCHCPAHFLKVTFPSQNKNYNFFYYYKNRGQRDGSSVKSMYCFCRVQLSASTSGGSQPPTALALEDMMPLVSEGTCPYVHTASIDTHAHN